MISDFRKAVANFSALARDIKEYMIKERKGDRMHHVIKFSKENDSAATNAASQKGPGELRNLFIRSDFQGLNCKRQNKRAYNQLLSGLLYRMSWNKPKGL